MSQNGWIGVDLDGTLAEYNGWQSELHIGKPIPLMIARVKKWLAQGKEIKIFTARVATKDVGNREAVKQAIENWCILHIGKKLEITCKKDYQMIELWDDRAVQVIPNTGKKIEGPEWYENLLEDQAVNGETVALYK